MDESSARYHMAGGGDFSIEDEVKTATHISLSKIAFLKELLVTQMNHWVFFPLLLALNTICKASGLGEIYTNAWFLFGIVPIVFYLFRKRIKIFPLLLTAHIAMAVICIISAHIFGWGMVYTMTAIIYVIYSLFVRMRTDDSQDKKIIMPVALIIAAVSDFFIIRLEADYILCSAWIIRSFIFVYGLSMLVTYLESYMNFLIVNRSSTGHIPAKEIFVSGSFMALVYVFFMTVVLFLSSGIGWLKTITSWLNSILAAVLRFLFSLIGPDEHGIVVHDTKPEIVSGRLGDIEEAEPSVIWEILTIIAVIALVCAFIYLLIKGIKKLYLYITEKMSETPTDADSSQLSSITDVREKCEAESGTDGLNIFKDILRIGLSPAEKIRKLYKKQILKYSLSEKCDDEHKSPQLFTAAEWAAYMKVPHMADIYEKTRYSQKEIDASDYKELKKLFK